MEQYVKYLRKSRFDRDYAELSTEETLKRHEAILDKIVADRGYYIAKTYHEVVSGESIAARPEIQKMLEEVSAGIYAGVLVVDVERLARGNGADQAYISQVFQFSGTKIITPTKIYDPSNEFDEEYFEFGLFMSRREYKTINRRLIRGRESSASEGKWINSITPYGYSRVKLPDEKGYTLEPHPDEAPVVQKIYEMYINHQGTKIIANYLNDHAVPTRHGELWTYSTISQIIANPVYMGKIRRGWSKQVKSIENGMVKKRIKRSRDMSSYTIYEGLHTALVSEEDFEKAQEVRLEKKPAAKVRDEFELKIGDSLREKIDNGLLKSKYGIVVISPDFIQKKWTAYEFNGMISKEMAGGKMILPIWHNVTKDAVIAYSPTLADKVALNTSIQTVAEIVTELKKLVSI